MLNMMGSPRSTLFAGSCPGVHSPRPHGALTLLLLFLLVLPVSSCEDRSSPPAAGRTAHSPQIRFDKRSEFGRILVVDEGDMRYLRFGSEDGGNQSTISLTDTNSVPAEYIRFAMLGMPLTSGQERVLMIGLGGGTFTTLLRRHYPTLWIDAVEIDPVVVEAAKRFFGVREDSHFRIHIEDGADFIERTQHPYDLIFLDVYSGDGMPKHLATREFFNAVKSKLSTSGVAMLNIWDEGAKEAIIEKRFRDTFPETACVRSADGFNLVLFGKTSATIPERQELVTLARRFTLKLGLSFDLGKVAAALKIECSGP